MADPVTLSWTERSTAPPARVWEALSDTDRFNQLAELGYRFEEHPLPDGGVRREGRARSMGMELRWDELPMAYVAPEWFRIERVFHGGAAERVVVQLRLRPAGGGGTELRYSVSVTPRSAFTRPLVQVGLSLETRPKLERALKHVLAELAGERLSGSEPLLGGPPPLDEAARALLAQRGAALADVELREALDRLVRHGPLRDQDRILPLRFAAERGMDPTRATLGLLEAVRVGLLTLRWELICPSCQGPTAHLDALGEPARRVHCASCNISFDGTFPDAVAASFRTAPALRRFEVPIECVGSPARQPHVLARATLAPGEQVELVLPLEVGPHRLRTWPPRDTASVEVVPEAAPEALVLAVDDAAFAPARSQRGPGEAAITVHNRGRATLTLALERRERPAHLMTVGQLLAIPGARALLPEQAIDPSLRVEAQRGAVALIGHGEAEQGRALAALSRHAPLRRVSGERGTLGTFPDAQRALAAALALAREGWPLTLTVGPLLEVGLVDEVVPMGEAVDEALRWMPLARAGQVLVPRARLDDPELALALQAAGAQPEDRAWSDAARAAALLTPGPAASG